MTIPRTGGVGRGKGSPAPDPAPSPSPPPFRSLGFSSAPRQAFFGRRSPFSGAARDDVEMVVVVVVVVVVVEGGRWVSRLQEAAAAVAVAVASRNLVTSFIPSLRRRLTASFLEPPGEGGVGGRGDRQSETVRLFCCGGRKDGCSSTLVGSSVSV